MSAKFSYVDIAVSMADSDSQSTTFLTDGSPAVELPALAGVAAHFENLDDGYLIWPTGKRRAFTYFVLDDDKRTTLLSVTILIERDVILSGRPISALINSIKTYLLEGHTLSSELVDEMLTKVGFPETPLRSEYDAWGLPTSGGVCCRSFATPAELTTILGFPRQQAYDRYRGVLVVSATALMIPGEELPRITAPVEKVLMVVCPEGVAASAEAVNFTDHLKVTYSCPGFDPVSVMFEVGTTNRYVRINGPALIVNDARHAGIIFRRRIPYKVISQSGVPIDTYTVLINGRTANRSEAGFEVTNVDFEHGDISIVVSSTNFSTYSRTFSAEQLEEATPLTIVLEPESRDILLRLDFGDGRVIEDKVNIEKNTPEYNALRSGRFHGFRAHRLMGATPETYNIDLRMNSQEANVADLEPALPGLDVETVVDNTEVIETEVPVAPEFVNETIGERTGYRSELKAPEFTNATLDDTNETTLTGGSKVNRERLIVYSKYAACVVAFLLICWIASRFIGGCGSSDGGSADSTAVVGSQTGQPVAPATPTITAEEQADYDYLNNNNVWRKDRLMSEKGIALFAAFESGEVDQIASADYFAVDGCCKNNKANTLVDALWKAKGKTQQNRHRTYLKKMAGKGSIDLYQLYDKEVSTCMPGPTDVNTDPRPKR